MSKAIKYAICGGAIGATFDLIFASIYYGQMGATPLRILHSVASGLLGASAREGGVATAVLGGVLHYSIAIAAALLFLAVARRFAWLVRHPFISGCIFGIGMHLTMNFIVLPLSAYPRHVSFDTKSFLITVAAHMFLFGQPIAWMISKGLLAKGEKA
jgi:hypothetical protein